MTGDQCQAPIESEHKDGRTAAVSLAATVTTPLLASATTAAHGAGCCSSAEMDTF